MEHPELKMVVETSDGRFEVPAKGSADYLQPLGCLYDGGNRHDALIKLLDESVFEVFTSLEHIITNHFSLKNYELVYIFITSWQSFETSTLKEGFIFIKDLLTQYGDEWFSFSVNIDCKKKVHSIIQGGIL